MSTPGWNPVRTPLLGLSQRSPPPSKSCVSTPRSDVRTSRFEHPPEGGLDPSSRGCQASSSFRPCRFSRLRRLAPHSTLQVCCTLLPVMGFAWFPASFPDARRTRLAPFCSAFLRGATPFEAFPSPVAGHRVTATRALPPSGCASSATFQPPSQASVTFRPRRLRRHRPQGLAPPERPLRLRQRLPTSAPVAPMGF